MQLVEERRTDWKKFLEVSQLRVQEVNVMVDSPFSNDDIIHIRVPYDWTWQKPGYSSLYCIGFVIDILTGLIDFEVVSKYCHNCAKTAVYLGSNTFSTQA